jgi:hypothetical protein
VDASAPRFLLGLGREWSLAYLRSSMKLKGHSTLSLLYPEPELIIMIPLNTNKPSIPILIRCDGTISKII